MWKCYVNVHCYENINHFAWFSLTCLTGCSDPLGNYTHIRGASGTPRGHPFYQQLLQHYWDGLTLQAEVIWLHVQSLKCHRHVSCSAVCKAVHVIVAIIIICSAPLGPRNAPNTVKSCLQKPLPSLRGKKFGNCFPVHNHPTPEQSRDEVCIQLKLEGGIKKLAHNYLIWASVKTLGRTWLVPGNL